MKKGIRKRCLAVALSMVLTFMDNVPALAKESGFLENESIVAAEEEVCSEDDIEIRSERTEEQSTDQALEKETQISTEENRESIESASETENIDESEMEFSESGKSTVDESDQTDIENTEIGDIAEETVAETENEESDESETFEIRNEETEESTTENDVEVNESDMQTLDSDEIIASGNCGLDEAVDKLTWTLTKDGTLTISGVGRMRNYHITSPLNSSYSVRRLVIKNGVTSIGDYAFYNCGSLTNLTLSDSLIDIGDYAFNDCSGLTGSLILPDGLTGIGDCAFTGCRIEKLTIPKNLTDIGSRAFGSINLESIEVDDNNTVYDSRDNCNAIIRSSDNMLIQGCKVTIIPDSVTSIGDGAFSHSGLTGSLTLPDGLTSIGEMAFSECRGLTGSLTLPDGLTSIGKGAFWGCSGLTGSLILPDGLTSIDTGTFCRCSGLTGSLTFPDGLKIIGELAFTGCSGLNGKLYIPESVTSIGCDAFERVRNRTIYGVSGSYAETYANRYGISFIEYTIIKPDSSPINISNKANFYVVDSELATPIEGAKLSSYGSSEVTDANGYAAIDIPEDISKYYIGVQVTAPGYETYYFKKMPEPDGTYYVTMELADDSSGGTSSGKIKLGYARATINGNYTNILTDKLYLEHTDKDIDSSPDKTTMDIWVKARGADINSYSIVQGNKVIATSSDGKFSLPIICEEGRNPLTSLDAQTEVSIRVVSTTNKIVTQKIGLCIGMEGVGYLEDKNGSLEIGKAISVTVPDSIPFLGGMSLKYGLKDALPFDMTIEQSGKVKIALNKSISESMEAFKDDYDQLSSRAKNLHNAAKAFGGTPQTFGAGSVSAKVSVKGYGEGYIDTSKPGTFVIKVGVIVSGSASAKYTQYFFAGTIPFYISVETGVKITGTDELAIESDEWILQTEGGVGTLSGKIYLAATGGVGVEKAINIHATGTGACNYYFKPIDEYTKVWLSAELELQSEFFGWELNLWKSDPAEYIIYESDKKTAKENDYVVANVYDSTAYSIMDRSYQSKESDIGISSYSREKNADRFVASNIYPGARPEMVIADGIYYLFWLQDIPTRSAENRAAVVYATSNDGVSFSSPRQLIGEKENQTFDNGIDLFADDGKIYVCWQDAAESYPSGISLMDAVKKLHISYAILDSATGNVLSYQTITDKEGCYMQPKIYVQDGQVRIAWVRINMTDSNNLWGADNQEELQIYDAASGEISILPIGSDKEKIISMDGAVGDGQSGVIYALDMDGDLATVNDRKIYFDTRFETKGSQKALTADTGIYANPVAAGGYYYWYADGNIEYAKIGTDTVRQFYDDILSDMNSDFVAISDGSNTELIWNAIDGETEKVSLYGIRMLGNGDWSRPFRIKQTDSEMTGALSGCMDSGVPFIAYQHIVRNEDGSKEYSISAARREDVIDVSLDYAEYDYGQFEPDQALPIMADITNKGTVAVKSLEVKLDGVSVGSKNVNLGVGETVTLEVHPVLGNITEYSDHVLSVEASGENMLDDNTYKMGIGYTDVKVLCNERQHDGKTWLDISVLNDSPVTSEATLNIRADKVDGEIIYTEDLGSIESEKGISMTVSLSAHEDNCCTYFVEVVTDVPDAIEGNNVEFVYTGYGTNVKGGSLVSDPVMYTVSFDSNGGSAVESQKVEADRSAIEPQSPIREGYRFLGWNKDGKPYNFYTPVTGNITLQAQWEEYEMLVSPMATIASGSKVEKGTKVFLTCAATGADIYYTIDGSDPTISSSRFTEPIIISEDMVIRAFAVMDGYKNSEIVTFTYTIDRLMQYTVIFNTNGGSNVEDQVVNENEPVIEPPVPTKDGYIFSGWYREQTCINQWNFITDQVTSDIILYAGWKAKDDNKDDGNKDDNNKDDDNKDDSNKDDDNKDDSNKDDDNKDDSNKDDDNKDDNNNKEDDNDNSNDDSSYPAAERQDLSALNASIAGIRPQTYNRDEQEPAIKVTAFVNGKKTTLTEGMDYRVSYKNNIDAGTATVIIKGNGAYKGSLNQNFTIRPKAVKKLKVVVGSLLEGATSSDLLSYPIYVYDGAKRLNLGTDYTLSSAGMTKNAAKVSIAGKGNYNGTMTAKLSVYSVSSDHIINPDNVRLDKDTAAYTGKPVKTVNPIVTVNGSTLNLNQDYKVQYQNNTNAGTAYVIVTGKGAYRGRVVLPFEIQPVSASIGGVTIKLISAKTYNGKLQKPAVSVTASAGGKTKKLVKNKDYKVTYKNNLHAGTATAIITGKGNYAGIKAQTQFTIQPQNIAKAAVKGTQSSLQLTYNKRLLKQGVHYEAPSYGGSRKNKVQVTIKGKGDFTGQVTKYIKQ